MSIIALVLATCASFTSALGSVFQSKGTKTVKSAATNGATLLLSLLRSRVWLFGAAMAGVSGLFHALALKRGPLIEVEAIMVTALLFALGLGTVISRSPVLRRDWIGAAAVIIGLVTFLGFADPQDGNYSIPASRWVVAIGVLAGATALLIMLARTVTSPNGRAALFATAAAVCLGTSAVLIKAITTVLGAHDAIGELLAYLVLLGLFELAALAIQQMAFRAGSLGAALAPFVGGNPMIAGAVGIVLFGERFHHHLGDLLGAALGIALVVGGIVVLAASPAVATGTGDGRRSGAGPQVGAGSGLV